VDSSLENGFKKNAVSLTLPDTSSPRSGSSTELKIRIILNYKLSMNNKMRRAISFTQHTSFSVNIVDFMRIIAAFSGVKIVSFFINPIVESPADTLYICTCI
jgi:hypothetical protein